MVANRYPEIHISNFGSGYGNIYTTIENAAQSGFAPAACTWDKQDTLPLSPPVATAATDICLQ